ncbi:uncharacterized protein LOC143144934 [Ptiloglossa arizonensis]|uniref:uncharacterized protein LOC143144934 n=1 Tax=Ptiloglossa arizonensis TaxID=3350558 RepID=UPI003FA0DA98
MYVPPSRMKIFVVCFVTWALINLRTVRASDDAATVLLSELKSFESLAGGGQTSSSSESSRQRSKHTSSSSSSSLSSSSIASNLEELAAEKARGVPLEEALSKMVFGKTNSNTDQIGQPIAGSGLVANLNELNDVDALTNRNDLDGINWGDNEEPTIESDNKRKTVTKTYVQKGPVVKTKSWRWSSRSENEEKTAEIRELTEAKIQAETRAREEAEARAKAEAEVKEIREKLKVQTEARESAEAMVRTEAEARARAESRGQSESKALAAARAEAKARSEEATLAEKKAKMETEGRLQLQLKIKSLSNSRSLDEEETIVNEKTKEKTEASAKASAKAKEAAKAAMEAIRVTVKARKTAYSKALESQKAALELEVLSSEAKAVARALNASLIQVELSAKAAASAQADARELANAAIGAAAAEKAAVAYAQSLAQISKSAAAKSLASRKAAASAAAAAASSSAQTETLQANAKNRAEDADSAQQTALEQIRAAMVEINEAARTQTTAMAEVDVETAAVEAAAAAKASAVTAIRDGIIEGLAATGRSGAAQAEELRKAVKGGQFIGKTGNDLPWKLETTQLSNYKYSIRKMETLFRYFHSLYDPFTYVRFLVRGPVTGRRISFSNVDEGFDEIGSYERAPDNVNIEKHSILAIDAASPLFSFLLNCFQIPRNSDSETIYFIYRSTETFPYSDPRRREEPICETIKSDDWTRVGILRENLFEGGFRARISIVHCKFVQWRHETYLKSLNFTSFDVFREQEATNSILDEKPIEEVRILKTKKTRFDVQRYPKMANYPPCRLKPVFALLHASIRANPLQGRDDIEHEHREVTSSRTDKSYRKIIDESDNVTNANKDRFQRTYRYYFTPRTIVNQTIKNLHQPNRLFSLRQYLLPSNGSSVLIYRTHGCFIKPSRSLKKTRAIISPPGLGITLKQYFPCVAGQCSRRDCCDNWRGTGIKPIGARCRASIREVSSKMKIPALFATFLFLWGLASAESPVLTGSHGKKVSVVEVGKGSLTATASAATSARSGLRAGKVAQAAELEAVDQTAASAKTSGEARATANEAALLVQKAAELQSQAAAEAKAAEEAAAALNQAELEAAATAAASTAAASEALIGAKEAAAALSTAAVQAKVAERSAQAQAAVSAETKEKAIAAAKAAAAAADAAEKALDAERLAQAAIAAAAAAKAEARAAAKKASAAEAKAAAEAEAAAQNAAKAAAESLSRAQNAARAEAEAAEAAAKAEVLLAKARVLVEMSQGAQQTASSQAASALQLELLAANSEATAVAQAETLLVTAEAVAAAESEAASRASQWTKSVVVKGKAREEKVEINCCNNLTEWFFLMIVFSPRIRFFLSNSLSAVSTNRGVIRFVTDEDKTFQTTGETLRFPESLNKNSQLINDIIPMDIGGFHISGFHVSTFKFQLYLIHLILPRAHFFHKMYPEDGREKFQTMRRSLSNSVPHLVTLLPMEKQTENIAVTGNKDGVPSKMKIQAILVTFFLACGLVHATKEEQRVPLSHAKYTPPLEWHEQDSNVKGKIVSTKVDISAVRRENGAPMLGKNVHQALGKTKLNAESEASTASSVKSTALALAETYAKATALSAAAWAKAAAAVSEAAEAQANAQSRALSAIRAQAEEQAASAQALAAAAATLAALDRAQKSAKDASAAQNLASNYQERANTAAAAEAAATLRAEEAAEQLRAVASSAAAAAAAAAAAQAQATAASEATTTDANRAAVQAADADSAQSSALLEAEVAASIEQSAAADAAAASATVDSETAQLEASAAAKAPAAAAIGDGVVLGLGLDGGAAAQGQAQSQALAQASSWLEKQDLKKGEW